MLALGKKYLISRDCLAFLVDEFKVKVEQDLRKQSKEHSSV